MSKGMWIVIILILISSILAYNNKKVQPWVKCKESLFDQIVFNNCTPSSFSRPQESRGSQEMDKKDQENLDINKF